MSKLYDADFVQWTRESAALLRARAFDKADIEHIAEEIEDLGKNWRRSLQSRLTQLTMHLLKIQRQSWMEDHMRSWRTSVLNQRIGIQELIEDAPSLQGELGAALMTAYSRARKLAASETGLDLKTFPSECPWTLEQVLDESFWPVDESAQ